MAGSSSEAQKQALRESLWLTYFNNCLYHRGIITEQERNSMAVRITSRHARKKQQEEA